MEKTKSMTEKLLSQSVTIDNDPFNPIAITYSNLEIVAKIKKTSKTIIYDQRGQLSPKTFTAILGPSGSGKTTLLNFLSGRLVSSNLSISGNYCLNGNQIQSVEPFANQIAYIMQDDILTEVMTPRECFMFAANLRIDASKQERERKVKNLIERLGLGDCCDTKIGGNLKKGISGGEKKRTSIGIDLITNPSLIFLDEPTTGLDSTTALQVIILLRQLANEGRTVISTIHQPSSEVFAEFDRLMLLVEGRCIFQGKCSDANLHFKNLGYSCPQLMSHSEFYMQLMSFVYKQEQNLQGSDRNEDYDKKREQYIGKMCILQQNYHKSQYYTVVNQDVKQSFIQEQTNDFNANWFVQFWYIYARALFNEIRTPTSFLLKCFQSVFASCIVLLVFGKLNTTDQDDTSDTGLLQNTRGVVFFLVSFCTMTGIQTTLNTFSGEKPIFLRERFSKTYSTLPYFWGRSLATFPFEIIYGSIPCIIIFWGCGLNNNNEWNFPTLLLVSNVLYFASVSYGLFYSAIIPKLETAMAMIPVLIIPFMMLSGFFINLDDVPKAFIPLEYLSPFRYGYQGMIMNEFHGKGYLSELVFIPKTILLNIIALLSLGVGLRFLSLITMYFISNPKRPKINQEKKISNSIKSQSAKSSKSGKGINKSKQSSGNE